MTAEPGSVRRTARILKLLAGGTRLSASDVSRRLDLPYPTCHRLLTTLREEALVDRDGAKLYGLSRGSPASEGAS